MTDLPLFVYGTLLSGAGQAGLLGSLRRTPARVRGTLWAMPAGYPALAPGDGGDVHGELVHGPDARVLRVLDHYEGVDEGLYRRARVRALVGLRGVSAWAYVMRDPARRGGRRILSGRWRRRGRV